MWSEKNIQPGYCLPFSLPRLKYQLFPVQLPLALVFHISGQSLLRERVVLPPGHERSHSRDTDTYQLLQLSTFDGKNRLTQSRKHLVGQGQQQNSSSCDGTSRDAAVRYNMCIHMLVLLDWQPLGAGVQFCTSAVSAKSMITVIKVFQIFQSRRVDVPLFEKEGRHLIQPIVHDGEQTVLDVLVLGHLFDEIAPAKTK
nr:MAG TPA: hypothetical protein [Caudoviricetes sp.]